MKTLNAWTPKPILNVNVNQDFWGTATIVQVGVTGRFIAVFYCWLLLYSVFHWKSCTTSTVWKFCFQNILEYFLNYISIPRNTFPYYGIGQNYANWFSNVFLQYFQKLFLYYGRGPIFPMLVCVCVHFFVQGLDHQIYVKFFLCLTFCSIAQKTDFPVNHSDNANWCTAMWVDWSWCSAYFLESFMSDPKEAYFSWQPQNLWTKKYIQN